VTVQGVIFFYVGGSTMVLRRVGVLSSGKIVGVMYAVLGLIYGGFFALISLAGLAIPRQNAGFDPMGFMLVGGAMMLIIAPIAGAIFGFISGIIAAAIYNVVASIAGGLELDFDSGPEYS
jgi:hypothetical protein